MFHNLFFRVGCGSYEDRTYATISLEEAMAAQHSLSLPQCELWRTVVMKVAMQLDVTSIVKPSSTFVAVAERFVKTLSALLWRYEGCADFDEYVKSLCRDFDDLGVGFDSGDRIYDCATIHFLVYPLTKCTSSCCTKP